MFLSKGLIFALARRRAQKMSFNQVVVDGLLELFLFDTLKLVFSDQTFVLFLYLVLHFGNISNFFIETALFGEFQSVPLSQELRVFGNDILDLFHLEAQHSTLAGPWKSAKTALLMVLEAENLVFWDLCKGDVFEFRRADLDDPLLEDKKLHRRRFSAVDTIVQRHSLFYTKLRNVLQQRLWILREQVIENSEGKQLILNSCLKNLLVAFKLQRKKLAFFQTNRARTSYMVFYQIILPETIKTLQ